jgi:tetratricopeptide (TPR) repeat protein
MACIETYEALLAESNSYTGVDVSIPFFQSDLMAEARRSRTRRYHVLIQLAHALRERYSHTGHGPDLDASIAQGQAALATCGTESVLCPTVLIIHASILQKSFQRTCDFDELHEAESMCRQALGLCTTSCTLTPTAYNALGWIMFRLYEGFGTLAYLDEAINLQQRGLDLKSAARGTEYHQYLRALAVYTYSRHEKLGASGLRDIDDTVSLLEQALELCPVMHICRMLIVQSMINAMESKYYLYGRLQDLNKAIDLGRQTVAAPNYSRGDRRLGLLNVLANLPAIRFQVALSTDCDVEELVSLRWEVFQCTSTSSVFRWQYALNLAYSLRFRFMQKGDLQDLEGSIELCRNTIDLLPEGHHERPRIFSSLGKALCQRFHEARNATDLDEALVSGRTAMAAMSPLHRDYSDVVTTIVSHLCLRFEVFQSVEDLDQAISLSEGLLKTIPDGHIDQDDTIRHLAKALFLRGARMKANAPEVSRTLAASYLVRFRLNQEPDDAAHALDITNDLLDAVGPGHYERFQCLIHAAELYLERDTPFRDSAVAVKHIAEAMSNHCRDVRSKIHGTNSFLDIVKIQYKDNWATTSPAISAQLLDIYI